MKSSTCTEFIVTDVWYHRLAKFCTVLHLNSLSLLLPKRRHIYSVYFSYNRQRCQGNE